jgi:hypothetical protein
MLKICAIQRSARRIVMSAGSIAMSSSSSPLDRSVLISCSVCEAGMSFRPVGSSAPYPSNMYLTLSSGQTDGHSWLTLLCAS